MRPPVSGRTRLAAVLGNPVRHSLSPVLFDAAAAARGVDLAYVALEVDAGSLRDAMEGVRALGFVGVNVTMPHKEHVGSLVDHCTDRATRLQAVNCVTVEDGRLMGDNTDGAGFLAGLRHDGIEVAGRRVAVLGAGGAARAICDALGGAGAALVTVHNRSIDRARVAAALAGDVGVVGEAEQLRAADVIVNATPLGMAGDRSIPLDPTVLRSDHVVVDIVYHPIETPLLAAAGSVGAQTINGLGMLIGQAGIAFERWCGIDAPVAEMRLAAVAYLGAG